MRNFREDYLTILTNINLVLSIIRLKHVANSSECNVILATGERLHYSCGLELEN